MSIHRPSATNNDILAQEDKGIHAARGVLARLFRTILYERGIDGPRWEVLMQRVLDDPRSPAPRNSKDRSSLKGNLNKAFRAPRMTWKTFEKAMRLLSPESMTFEVHLKWFNGETTIHNVTQDLGGFRPEDYADILSPTGHVDADSDSFPSPNLDNLASIAVHYKPDDLPDTPTEITLAERVNVINEAFLDIQRAAMSPPRRTPTT